MLLALATIIIVIERVHAASRRFEADLAVAIDDADRADRHAALLDAQWRK